MKSYVFRTSTELRLLGHDQGVARTTLADVNRAFIARMLEQVGSTKLAELMGTTSRGHIDTMLVTGSLTTKQIDSMLERAEMDALGWLLYMHGFTQAVAKLRGERLGDLRVVLKEGEEEEEVPALRGQRDAIKDASGAFDLVREDLPSLPLPPWPSELLQRPKKGPAQKPEPSSR